MIYLTQLIYLKPDETETFHEFEALAIPIIAKYNGQLMLRTRPTTETIIEANIGQPYEIHLVSFETEDDFQRFMQDEERKRFLHLKEKSIRSVFMTKGEKI